MRHAWGLAASPRARCIMKVERTGRDTNVVGIFANDGAGRAIGALLLEQSWGFLTFSALACDGDDLRARCGHWRSVPVSKLFLDQKARVNQKRQ
jgi:hypothetical protein